jgi:hypothetical protein
MEMRHRWGVTWVEGPESPCGDAEGKSMYLVPEKLIVSSPRPRTDDRFSWFQADDIDALGIQPNGTPNLVPN